MNKDGFNWRTENDEFFIEVTYHFNNIAFVSLYIYKL
jgi:hypothetical protein